MPMKIQIYSPHLDLDGFIIPTLQTAPLQTYLFDLSAPYLFSGTEDMQGCVFVNWINSAQSKSCSIIIL